MENPLVTTLTVTLVGMAVVFAAMGLILGSMALLTRLAQQRPTATSENGNHLESSARLGLPPTPHRQAQLRAAAVAVALARARVGGAGEDTDVETPLTPWGDYYRRRQLRPAGRGRVA